jgi:hypothetical protein
MCCAHGIEIVALADLIARARILKGTAHDSAGR